MTYRLGWFTTARGPGSRRLLAAVHGAIQSGELPAEIAFVFCSRGPGESRDTDAFFEQVKGYGLPLVYLSRRQFNKQHPSAGRSQYDAEVMALIAPYPVNAIVLAGYMLVSSADLCRNYPLINLHPALPGGPQGTWQDVIWQLIDRRATESGVMVHLATPELDQGPVISYCRYYLRGGELDNPWAEIGSQRAAELKAGYGEGLPLFQAIRQRGFIREIPLLMATLVALARGEIVIQDGKVLSAAGKPLAGQDLTEQVERALGTEGSGR